MNEVPNENSKRYRADVSGNPPTSDAAAKSLTRRSLTRASLGAPILMTLASKPAFGLQCLSNMMSGNLSDPNRGNICKGGWSPGGWKNPVGMIHTYSTIDAWQKAGYAYGVLPVTNPGNENKAENYVGGSLWSSTPFTPPAGALSTITIREVLINYPGSLQFHLAAGWLNAKLSAADPTFIYFLTPAQLISLASPGAVLPVAVPPYADLKDFLDRNYHKV